MNRIAGCDWRPLPENEEAPAKSDARIAFILHSAVGSSSPWGYFARESTRTESTGWTGLDGDSEQFLGLNKRADAQWDANPWAWSWETADNGHPDTFKWTPAQCEELARIMAWLHVNKGLPLRLCRTWDDNGVGWHRMFPEWNRNGHTCPGTVRVKQVPAILARATAIVEEMSMPSVDDVWHDDHMVVKPENAPNTDTNPDVAAGTALESIWRYSIAGYDMAKEANAAADGARAAAQAAKVAAEKAAAAAAVGGIDYHALAIAVVDELHARTEK